MKSLENSVSALFTACFARDNHTCQDCKCTGNLVVHHITPISQGGTNNLDNLKTVCKKCHKENYKSVHYPADRSIITPIKQRTNTRYGIDKSKMSQVLITFPIDLLEEVDQYWHQEHIMNRNEAVRQLIVLGLQYEKARE